MDSALGLLKEEINQTFRDQHDLSKWKLIVTASIATAAIGLNSQDSSNSHKDILPWLFLFIPLVCAYVDMLGYQYQMRILVLSNFIRKSHPCKSSDEDDAILASYEEECSKKRQHTAQFSYGNTAGLASSLIASFAALIGFFALVIHPFAWPGLRPFPWHLLCFLLVWYLEFRLIYHCHKRFEIDEHGDEANTESYLLPQQPAEINRKTELSARLFCGMDFLFGAGFCRIVSRKTK